MPEPLYIKSKQRRRVVEEYRPPVIESYLNLAIVVTGIAIVAAVCPLSSPGFRPVCIVAGCLCLAYAVYKLVRDKRIAVRWGLPFTSGLNATDSLAPIGSDMVGCNTLFVIFAICFLPATFARVCLQGDLHIAPSTYLPWCVVQDFLFFAIFFKSAEDLIGAKAAAVVGALVFAASHYPIYSLAALSGVAYLLWAYLYVVSRSLGLVILCHFVLGIMVLA